MKATIVDLRYKMNDVLKALDRNEEVTILYRGKAKGKIIPVGKKESARKVKDHPYFGSVVKSDELVDDVMDRLRSVRFL